MQIASGRFGVYDATLRKVPTCSFLLRIAPFHETKRKCARLSNDKGVAITQKEE